MPSTRTRVSPTGDAPGARSAARAGHALYLDIDGTLLDLASSPDAVEVPEWMVPLLQRLSSRLDGAVAFVSGRTDRAIDELFRPLKLPAIGVHGGEIRTADGPIVTTDASLVAELHAGTGAVAAGRDRARCRGVHAGGQAQRIRPALPQVPERGREVLQGRRARSPAVSAAGFGVLHGQMRGRDPAAPPDQGRGDARLMERAPFRDRTPIFAGDDSTDEDAFEVVNRLGGISVRVGEAAPTAARYRLAEPEQLRALAAVHRMRPGAALNAASLDLGLTGNCQVASLIDGDGTHVWTCLPRLDGDPVFCDLLAGSAARERAGPLGHRAARPGFEPARATSATPRFWRPR